MLLSHSRQREKNRHKIQEKKTPPTIYHHHHQICQIRSFSFVCLSQFKNKQTENFPERKISIIFCTDLFLFEEKIKGKEQMTKKN